jgi:hypothetical protein
MKKVIAKFRVVSIKQMVGQKEVELTPVSGEDFTEYTPYGNLVMGLSDKSNADELFEVGENYLLTFEKAE